MIPWPAKGESGQFASEWYRGLFVVPAGSALPFTRGWDPRGQDVLAWDLGVGRSDLDLSVGRGRAEASRGGCEGIKLGNKLYVGNLPFGTTEADLTQLFEKHGALLSVKVITDRETGRSRGFGFVEYEEASSADEALKSMGGTQIEGRELRINEAHDKRGDGGGGRGGGYR